MAVCALTAAVSVIPVAGAYAQAAAPADTVSLDLRDAPVRQALEQLFRNAGKNYSIDSNIQGYVTLKVTDQPFDTALRLLMRSSNPPLTYDPTNGIYQVRQRAVPSPYGDGMAPPSAPPSMTPEGGTPGTTTKPGVLRKMAPLIYQDSAALAVMFGGSVLPVEFGRNSNSNGGGNSLGGGTNGNFGGNSFGGGFGGGGNSFGGGGNSNFGGNSFGGNSFGGGNTGYRF